MSVGCPWWARWLHRRRRRVDVTCMLAAICERTTDPAKRAAVWQMFIRAPGQEHWFCACATADHVAHACVVQGLVTGPR